MAEEIALLVRVPVSEIVKGLREKHRIGDPFSEVRIEADSLVFYFTRAGGTTELTRETPVSGSKTPPAEGVTVSVGTQRPRKRRARRRRNRIKTRGWDIVATITNSRGQRARIYKPFVEALKSGNLTPAEQRAAAAKILRANGNRPSEESVGYFLDNTMEYIKQSAPSQS